MAIINHEKQKSPSLGCRTIIQASLLIMGDGTYSPVQKRNKKGVSCHKLVMIAGFVLFQESSHTLSYLIPTCISFL
jgi:hypothetical protein